MKRHEYPNAAFAHVNDDAGIKLLLHHDPDAVHDGNEHSSVDPLLLMYALEVVDRLKSISEKEREDAKHHLQLHANVILWQDEDVAGLPIALSDKLRDTAFFKVNMDGVAEVPPVTTEARGTAYCMLDKRTKEFSWFLEFEGLSGAQTPSHFHVGKGGKLGEIVIPVPNGSPSSGSQILSDELVTALFEGNLYLNIHSSNYPLGEIRGQVIPTATSRSNNRENPFAKKDEEKDEEKENGNGKKKAKKGKAEQIKPPKEKKPKAEVRTTHEEGPNGAVYSDEKSDAEQITPPKEVKPKAEVRNTHKEGEHGAVYSQELEREPTLPAGTPVRPGILEALEIPGDDIFEDGQIQAPKENEPTPEVRNTHKQGDKGAVFSSETGIAPKEPTKPAGTPVRPGILEALKIPGDDILPDGQIQPPKEATPKAQTPTTHKQGEHGAVFSKDKADGEQVKPPKEAKPKAQTPTTHKQGDKGAVYSKDEKGKGSRTDLAQPAVNVDTRPEGQDVNEASQRNIRQNGNPTGAANPPKVVSNDQFARISVSNLTDRNNADLRQLMSRNKPKQNKRKRPGEGNTKLGGRVVQFFAETTLDNRRILFPSTGTVLEIQGAPKKIDELEDSVFAAIERGGKFRHLPFSGAADPVDLLLLRSSLKNMNRIKANSEKEDTDRLRRVARSRLIKAAKRRGFAAKGGKVKLADIVSEVDVAICDAFVAGKFPVAKAQLLDVIEEGSVKTMRVVMGDKDFPFNFFVRVMMDGEGNARDVVFDFDTFLPARLIPDFTKFLRGLPVKKDEE